MELVPRTSPLAHDAPWARPTARGLLAAFAATLLWLALARHTVGDYGAESDFYGGYAAGARAIQQGTWDVGRYVVVGPGYEAVLALVGGVIPDLFTAAKLISVASAVGALGLWFALLAGRVGPGPSLWVLAFLIANPVIVRYGYAASTDMLAVFLQTASLFAMLAMRGSGAALVAGVLAGVAVLTRYSALYLVPGAGLVYGWMPPQDRSRGRSLAACAVGFLVVVGPWLMFSLAHGTLPGEGLARGYAFYAAEHGSWNVQDDFQPLDGAPPRIPGWGEVVGADPRAFLADRLRAIPSHLGEDARDLLGWPGAIALLLGLALLWRHPARSRLVPIAVIAGLCFITLLAVFHSSRYSLPLVMFYATAASGFAFATAAAGVPRSASWIARAAGLVAVALTLVASVHAQRRMLDEAPREVIAAGRALNQAAAPLATVIGRKGHIGYYSDRAVVPFPRVRTLRELGDYARHSGAEFLYFSWFETQVRPEFAYLLDTTAAIPGLTVVYASDDKPAVLYRLGPEFGRPPDWLANGFQKSVHVARSIVGVMGDRAPATHHVVLAVNALLRQQWLESLHHSKVVTDADPTHALAWAVEGEALRRLARFGEARDAYRRAIALDPRDPAAKIGLGRIELVDGNREGAARLWRAAAGTTDDAATLSQIAGLLGSLADSSGVRDIRRELERIARESNRPRLGAAPGGAPSGCQRWGPLAGRARRSASL